MAESMHKKTVWITGGGSGIGASVAKEFARKGAIVFVSGRRLESLQNVVAQIGNAGDQAFGSVCDVNSEESCRVAVSQIVEQTGQLDIVFANAGFGISDDFDNLTVADWRRQFETNVFGLLNTIYAALSELKKSKGRLALTSSVMGYLAAPRSGPYAASKYAARAIGETAWLELKKYGVSVTTVCPGFVHSEIGQVDNEGVFHEDWQDKRPSMIMWQPERAAKVITKAIVARRRELIFTGHGKVAVWMTRLAPGLLYRILGAGKSKV